MIKAILFDLDGVLIETEKETFEFYKKYLAKKKIYLQNEDFFYKIGRKSAEFWNDVLTPDQKKLVDTEKLTQLKRRLFINKPAKYVKKIPGGKQLLSKLRSKGFQTALVSQNEKAMVESVLRWLQIRTKFDVVLSIDDITNKKPHPEIYLLAAKKLNVRPNECLAIEDSKDGVQAVKSAGMLCAAVMHSYTPLDYIKEADIKIKKLQDIEKLFLLNPALKEQGFAPPYNQNQGKED